MALSGLITVLHAFLDMKYFIFGKYHYMLYFLALAMQVYMLKTLSCYLLKTVVFFIEKCSYLLVFSHECL